ncbi:hypothetical protein AXI64_gp220 [Vibrio phage qdvp001]|uniref:hypothetical protein n=1 Tax=Vibrio phage qdvp001 TaxID=1003177 RepID=UPI000721B7B9|nr:hypothetical protein AXI64_gp220 [Vibrio phage qdvp001]ALM62212.1 hypothetical protein qdvp001_220 [Vibrio phage qdvp001]
MTITDRKIEVEPLFLGLLYKVVEYKKLDNGYYESWYSTTKTIHTSYENALKSLSNFK